MEKTFSIKDKINFFQSNGLNSSSDNNQPNHAVSFNKSSEKKYIISEGKDSSSFKLIKNFNEKTISKEIQKFLDIKPVFPCLLISKDENGKIEMNMNCLDDIDIHKIKIIKEDSFEIAKREDIMDSQLIDSNLQYDISVIHNKSNFLKKDKAIEKKSHKNNIIIGKYKLYSFNINKDDLSFKKHFLDKFENIANSNSSDTIKAKEIDEIFENQGYYIPLKIYIGGLFLNRYNKENIRGLRDSLIGLNKKYGFQDNEFQLKGKLSSGREISQIFINENTQIIGGDKTEKNFDNWTKSVKIFNSNLIECTNIIEAKNILANELKQKLEIPLQMVEQKYLARKKYIQIIKSIKDIKIEKIYEFKDISKGVCQESDVPKIYKTKLCVYTEQALFNENKKVNESFSDIIVGFEIISEMDAEYIGMWKIYTNPLLQKEINMCFFSYIAKGQRFSIYIYLMKFPE